MSADARIVITGAGVISSIGGGVSAFSESLFAGRRGLGLDGLAPIADFTPETWLGNKGIRVLDRSARLLCVATRMALTESALDPRPEAADEELGMVCGTMFGGLHSIVSFDWSGITDGPSYVNPMEFPNTVINSPAGQAAIKFRLRSLNSTVSAGFASGLSALHYGMDALRFGRARALLCGGVDELCEESIVGFRKTGIVSTDGRVSPFAHRHAGTIPGEGSAMLAMETDEDARARGAKPMAEVAGTGVAYGALGDVDAATATAAATAAVRGALDAAGISESDVGCVISGANGTGSDAIERVALASIFGSRLSRVPVSAPKAALGEAMGASGALCALAAVLALQASSCPPTAGAESSAELSLSSDAQRFDGDHVLVTAIGCQGHNAALVLRRTA